MFVLALWLPASDAGPALATAPYSRGPAEIHLRSVSRNQSHLGPAYAALMVSLELRLLPHGVLPGTSTMLAGDFYLNCEKSSLVSASLDETRKRVPAAHAAMTPAQGPFGTMILSLQVPVAVTHLRDVEMEFDLARITAWDTREFQIGPGASDLLPCGPFELKCLGTDAEVRIESVADPRFRREHRAFHRQTPLHYLANPASAHSLLTMMDAAGRRPALQARAVGHDAPLALMTYGTWAAAGVPATEHRDVTYPVTLRLRIPKAFESERVKFRIPALPLAAVE